MFWESIETSEPHTITLHENLEEIEKYFIRLLVVAGKEFPKKRIAQMFENQEKMVVKKVQIVFGKAGSTQ